MGLKPLLPVIGLALPLLSAQMVRPPTPVGHGCYTPSFLRHISPAATPSLFRFRLCYPKLPGRDPATEELNLRLRVIPLHHFNRYWLGVDFREMVAMSKETGWDYYYTGDGKVYRNTPRLLSVLFYFEGFAGGAHPNQEVESFNWDREEWRPVELPELFQKGALPKLKELLLRWDRTHRQLISEPEGVFESGEPIEFVVTPRGIKFLFQKYQVAPGAAGIVEVEVPFSELKPLLSPRGRKLLGL